MIANVSFSEIYYEETNKDIETRFYLILCTFQY